MWRNLVRSAYSTIVREASDAATAIFDSDGEMVAQGARTVPMLLESLQTVIDGLRERELLNEVTPGDALITNDSYAGGQHLWDVILVVPVFHKGQRIAFCASSAHHLDVGGSLPGLNPLAREIFEEGIIIPPLRVKLRDLDGASPLTALITRNVRVPGQWLGDLRAQIAAVQTGERRVRELAERYGAPVLRAAMRKLLVDSDAMMRRAIAALPDGAYRAVQHAGFVEDGRSRPLRVAVAVRIAGDRVTVDLGGSDPQVDGPVNVPLGSTISTIHFTLKQTLVPPETRPNAGCYRAISINAPEGSLFNPRFPAAVGARHGLCYVLFDALQTALAPVLSDKLIASSYGSITAVGMGRRTPTTMYVYREGIGGGYGGGDRYIGADAVATLLVNASNVPVEFAEQNHPYFLVESYRVRAESGGPGLFRGGAGIEKTYRILEDGVRFIAYADRYEGGPPGLAGGGSGSAASITLVRGGVARELPLKPSEMLRAGDVVIVTTAGGGGFGDLQGTRGVVGAQVDDA
jgi:N-methylhydantoinase B